MRSELVVDLFAGGGGASTGIEQAIGRAVDVAINHDPEAISLHRANHPQTRHYCGDVFEVDPLAVCGDQPVGLLWASPDCKHFSKAKGGKPRSKKIRALAWIVIKWIKRLKPTDQQPRMIYLENVEEFVTWGPLLTDGQPCPVRKGSTYRRWLAQLRKLGYQVETRELRACDYGAPTIRKRFFLVARCDGQPIVWPEKTHGPGLKPYRTAAECIDWSIPCPSIFERERPLAEATLRRIAHGIKRYVIDAARPFIVPVTHGNDRMHSAKRGELALAAPSLATIGYGEREWQAPRVQDPSKPPGTVVGANKPAVGAAFLAKHFGGEPQAGKTAAPLDAPAPTVLASGGPQALVEAHFAALGLGVDEAITDAIYKAADLVGAEGPECAGRPKRVDDPLGTVTATDHRALVTAQLAKLRGTSNSASAAAPLGTVSAQGEHHALVSSHLMTNTTGHAGGAVDDPLHTITTGNHHAEVRALLLKYYGTNQDPNLREPLHTVTTKDRFGLVTVKGVNYFIADIGMRMLQPRELYRAQGFPDTYIIDHGADGRILSKAAQVRMCGNSVCPPVARLVVEANYPVQDQRKVA